MQLFSTDPNKPGVFAIGQEAMGIIAFGQLAVGFIAIGQLARGVIAVGQLATGVVAVGQLGIGVLHATGMVGIGGRSGYGFVLHTLPQRVAQNEMPSIVPVALEDVRSGALANGWVEAKLDHGKLTFDGGDVGVRTLEDEIAKAPKHHDRAFVFVRREEEQIDTNNYREAKVNVTVVGTLIQTYPSKPRKELRYGGPPAGKPTVVATRAQITVRAIGFLGVVAAFTVLVVYPIVTDVLQL